MTGEVAKKDRNDGRQYQPVMGYARNLWITLEVVPRLSTVNGWGPVLEQATDPGALAVLGAYAIVGTGSLGGV